MEVGVCDSTGTRSADAAVVAERALCLVSFLAQWPR